MIKIGNSSIDNILIGTTQVDKVYLGTNVVWEHSLPVITKNYLKFTALESGTFTLTIPAGLYTTSLVSISYSVDGGNTWTTTLNENDVLKIITTPTISTGQSVLWKGDGNRLGYSDTINRNSVFSSTGTFECSGNILSLLYGDDFDNKVVFPNSSDYTFIYLFRGCNKLTSILNLLLPATTLNKVCYRGMFYECSSLTTVPSNLLPATTLTSNCYRGMFYGCSSLTNAPVLPATSVPTYAYGYMFCGCLSLLAPPQLPATTIGSLAYNNMFYNCKKITTVPLIQVTQLAEQCFTSMFYGCSSLTDIPNNMLIGTSLANQCCYQMFRNCTSLTTVPSNFLPATTLSTLCYRSMFMGCSKLETAPDLPASILTSYCYYYMFLGAKVNSIKCLATDISASNCIGSWLSNVPSVGTFYKDANTTWPTGASGIPSGWTVVDVSS